METIANKDSAAKKKQQKLTKLIFFYYTIKHSVRYLYPSFRNKQTNKQTNKRKTKQNKTKPKNTVKAQGVSYLAKKDETTSLFLLLLFIIVHIICFALNVNKIKKKH